MIESKKDIEELVASYLSGDITESGREELFAWIESVPENHAEFSRLRNIWEAANPAFDPRSIDTQAALENVMSRIRTKWYDRGFMRRAQRIAAVMFVPLAGLSLYMLVSDMKETDRVAQTFQEVVSPYGTRSVVDLPDGSKVWLNAGSSLKYPLSFTSGKREVELSGEAYFDVESDAKNPFIVSTGDLTVRATGTEFNVEAYEGSDLVAVTMIEGLVDVTVGEENATPLQPNQRLAYSRQSEEYTVLGADADKWVSWKDGVTMFRNDRLDYIFARLSQIYNVDIVIKDDKIGSYLFRATFKDESLDEILDLISMSTPIRYKISDRQAGAGDDQYSKRRIEVYKSK